MNISIRQQPNKRKTPHRPSNSLTFSSKSLKSLVRACKANGWNAINQVSDSFFSETHHATTTLTVWRRILLSSCSCVHSVRLNIDAISVVDRAFALFSTQPRLWLDYDDLLEMVRANPSCPKASYAGVCVFGQCGQQSWFVTERTSHHI